jgi:hypothetical protein
MRRQKIYTFVHNYHIDYSKSHLPLIGNPLSKYCDMVINGWDGNRLNIKSESYLKNADKIIFHQLPPQGYILGQPKMKIIWIPMWDSIRTKSLKWWYTLPKTLRVVAFCDNVYDLAMKAGLPAIKLKLFVKPDKTGTTDISKKRALFYWNRTGTFQRDFIEKLCDCLRVDKLLFQYQIDPGVPREHAYRLPRRLKGTEVEEVGSNLPSDRYSKITKQANIYLAPRMYEGVGLTFIEALSRGCAVFGMNNPTMNEYITNSKDGYLFSNPPKDNSFTNNMVKNFKKLYLYIFNLPKEPFTQKPSINQNWNEISKLDLNMISQMAYERSKTGFIRWQKDIPKFADFVLNW